ncbi:MAG TPA: thioredoxin family protein [Gammaproteobacteria bacterium]|nr:thioredoxin family protein [Gammaproteobacteria bacterium]
MVARETPLCEFGRAAPDFLLRGVDGRSYTLMDCRGEHATLVMFICNHCPYVRASIDRTVAVCNELAPLGLKAVAIMSNDVFAYPDDSVENMKAFASGHHFPFPYLYDETQETARAYGAVCTPDFFGFNAGLELQYRGRLDEGRTSPPKPGAKRELFDAMKQIIETGKGPKEQVPSIGCSVKWK